MRRIVNQFDESKPSILTLPNELLMMVAEYCPQLSLTCRRCYALGTQFHPVITAIHGPNAPKLDRHSNTNSHHMTLKRFNRYLVDLTVNDERAEKITVGMYKHNGGTRDVECDSLRQFGKLINLTTLVYQTDSLDLMSIANFDNFITLKQLNVKLNYIPTSINHFITRLMRLPTLELLAIDVPCTTYEHALINRQLSELEDISTYIPIRNNFKFLLRFCHTTTCSHLSDSDYDFNIFTIVFSKCMLCRNHFLYATSRQTIYSTIARAYGWPDNKHTIKRRLKETQLF